MANPLVVSVGSVNVDLQVRTERWPRPGETLLADDFLMAGGGKAANVALLARRLGCASVLAGRVGDDLLAQHALGPLEAEGVDLRHVRRVRGVATSVAMIDVRADGEKAILLARNANEAWDDDDIADAVAAVDDAPEGSVLAVDLEVPSDVVRATIEAARRRGHQVVVDPSPADRADTDLLGHAGCLTPNPAEAEALVGVAVDSTEDGCRAGRELLAAGVGAAFVKLGADGCVLVTADGAIWARPEARDAVDTTGAGDAFTAGVAVALAEGAPLDEAARFAVATSSLAVMGYGSQASYPRRGEVDAEVDRVDVRSLDGTR